MKGIQSLIAMSLLIIATACGNDDKDAPVNIAAEASGTFTGYTLASCAYFQGDLSTDQKVIVTESATAGKVDISFVSDSWGTVSVTAATVAEGETGYPVAGHGRWSMGMDGNIKEYDCNVTGVVKPGATSFTFSCPSVMGGLIVEFNEGDAPAE